MAMKKLLYIVAVPLLGLTAAVLITNRNSPDMTIRQKILRTFYPLLTVLTRKNALSLKAPEGVAPAKSIYDLNVDLIDGNKMPLSALKGKKIMFVNTASDCGYTGQYDELQALHVKDPSLVIIGFPANDFKEQEKGDDHEIAAFCRRNYGVTFPLAKKSVVIKGAGQNEIFRWLSDKNLNGWNSKPPSWNFSKYIVDEQGRLAWYLDPSVTPGSAEFQKALP
jgi:glutathione peroxidase